MTILIIATGFIAAGMLFGLFATATAPVGYEDETGFHFGNEQGETAPRRETAPLRHIPGATSFTPKHA